jgi:DNA-directed RNA polymerase subunit M/transcription elongation factor TFIIS
MGRHTVKVFCPKCRELMKPSQQKPVLFAPDFFEITFACKKCGAVEKRTVRRDEKPSPMF